MAKNMAKDIYVYPETNVLINKHGIRDQNALEDLESSIFMVKNSQPLPKGNFDYDHLKKIHHHFFGELYDWAGKERRVDISKGESLFARKEFISQEINKICKQLKSENDLKGLDIGQFCQRAAYFFNEINAVHPFREGNGRTLRGFITDLSNQAGFHLEWSKVDRAFYIDASIAGFKCDNQPMELIFKKITSPLELNLKNVVNISPDLKESLRAYLKIQSSLCDCVKNKELQKAKKLEIESKRLAKGLIHHREFMDLSNKNLNPAHAKNVKPQAKRMLARLEASEITMNDIHFIFEHAKRSVLNLKNQLEKKVSIKL